jgi:hypothetical protein
LIMLKTVEQSLSAMKAINEEKEKVEDSFVMLERLGKAVFLVELNHQPFIVPQAVGDIVVMELKKYYQRRNEELIRMASELIKQQQ